VRAARPLAFPDPRAGSCRSVRVARGLVQPAPAALRDRIPRAPLEFERRWQHEAAIT
jgi:hypothetical protein